MPAYSIHLSMPKISSIYWREERCARKVYRRSRCMKRNTRLPLTPTANGLASVLNILFAEYRHSYIRATMMVSRTKDINRCYVVHRTRIYIRITTKQVGHLRQTVQPARGSETKLLERVLENAHPGEKEREKPKSSKKQVYSAM